MGLGTDITLGDLKVRLPSTGNVSLQVSANAGTTYYVYGSQLKIASGTLTATRIDGAFPLTVNTTPAYLNSSDNYLASGDISTWTIMDTTTGIAWRITVIIGQGYASNLIKIEKL